MVKSTLVWLWTAVPLLLVWSSEAGAQAIPNRDSRVTHVVLRTNARAIEQRNRRFPSGDTELLFDLYRPTGRGPLFPAIVFISGTSDSRDWTWFRDYGRLAVAHGFVGLVPEKRFPRGIEGVRTGLQDSRAFVEFIRDHGPSLGIDPNRICVWLFSAGGAMAATFLQSDSPRLACLIGYYPVLSTRNLVAPETINTAPPPRQVSPVEALTETQSNRPPMLIVRAGRDSVSLNAGIADFLAAAFVRDVKVTLINDPDGEHGFDGFNDTDESRSIIEETFHFAASQAARQPRSSSRR